MKIGIIAIFLLTTAFGFFLKFLTWKKRNAPVPENVNDVFDSQTYLKRNAYQMEKMRLGIFSGIVTSLITLAYLVFNFHSLMFEFIAGLTSSVTLQAFFIFGVTMCISVVSSTAFSAIDTFKIEAKYGFNKSTVKTFIVDTVKELILTAAIIGGLLSLFLLMYAKLDTWMFPAFYLIVIIILFAVNFLAHFFSKLFNKFTTLEEGTLKDKINAFASKTGFKVKRIFIMNASKRSTKLNAYATGFGKNKTIVLYDTLISKMTEDEIVAVLAHEIGHAKKGHVYYKLLASCVFFAIMVFAAQYVISSSAVAEAFGFSGANVIFGIYILTIAFTPLSLVLNIPICALSRAYEFAADKFAKDTAGGEHIKSALKKLAKENFSNLTPHKFVVLMTYSHPPLSERIEAIDK